jgi:urease accessory protein UreE
MYNWIKNSKISSGSWVAVKLKEDSYVYLEDVLVSDDGGTVIGILFESQPPVVLEVSTLSCEVIPDLMVSDNSKLAA